MSRFNKKTTGLITSTDLKNYRMKIFYWFIFLLMVVFAIICFFPPLWLFISSLKNVQEIYSMKPALLPETVKWNKIIDVWVQLNFFTYYINSLKVMSGEIVFSILFNSILGYVLSQLKPKGTSLIMILLLWTLLLPNTVNIVPVYKNIINFPFLHINLSNTYWPLWFMAGANSFFTLIFKSFFDEIPRSYTEAALLDGCSSFRIFTSIFVPLSKPVVFVITILTFTRSWSDFFWPYMVLSDKNNYTVMIRLFSMMASGNTGKGLSIDYQMLAIVYSMIPPIIIFFFLQKYILKGGLTLGGIKG